MAQTKFDVSAAKNSFNRVILRQMEMVYEKEVNRMATEFAERMKTKLMEVVADYMVKIHEQYNEFNLEHRVVVEVVWNNGYDESKDSTEEVD